VRAGVLLILRALHTGLGRWLAVGHPVASSAPAPKRRAKPRKRARDPKEHGAEAGRAAAPSPGRSGCSWFDLDPGALTPPRSAEDEDAAAWYASHFRQGWPRQ